MANKGFDFEASVPVMRAMGLGDNTPGKGFSQLMIFSPGLRAPLTVNLSEILFIRSDEVDAKTFAPCYDETNKVMAFPSEESIVWHFRAWQIHLDRIQKEEDQPRPSAEKEITMTM
ncbi:MAG: hypothetical protein NTX82_04485 [Candidatus Parcubacteria bacterium]|nr:hypothetical protein [Candidatus Parcubacteria bacterium]